MFDYTNVTEVPGDRVSSDAIDMVVTRYELAARHSVGKRVLEIGCGPGVGLRFLAGRGAQPVGGDYTFNLLQVAKGQRRDAVALLRFDAHALPFADASFDVVLLFETLYFFADAPRVVEACTRVLSESGTLLIATANPESPGFNPAPLSTKYWSAADLQRLLGSQGYRTTVLGGFPVSDDSIRDRALTQIKRAAVRLGLIPQTMKGKEVLKRLVYGRLESFPADVSESGGVFQEPVMISNLQAARNYRVIYSIATKDAPC